MQQPIFLQPIFQERIWGGTSLRDRFGYDIPSDHTGECWAISAHPHGPSIVRDGLYKGIPLDLLWTQHPELFGHFPGKTFPLLTKILDANTDLSVQVHPDDTFAYHHENSERGKTECWYIIDCKPGAELIYGHHAQNREELQEKMERGEWDTLLQRLRIKPGDFFYVPSGTIHALGSGTLVLETQQSSDTTYRVYDYDRKDDSGNKRELHLDKALDVTTIPHYNDIPDRQIRHLGDGEWTTYVTSEYFTVHRWQVDGVLSIDQEQPFLLASVLDGAGEIETFEGSFPFQKGDHLILPHELDTFRINGKTEWIVSHV
ncbi:mannose-6-phosphate isomerase, type 1 [Marininema mesophilum]|uniref:Mannose-6-phosphate isomerase n=1 Tax=Marininema mesophilum TaxID=1048340 RepID=A0A1H3BAG0_9BACL|nr:mannose-6-phosphate isomerase, class I [Marininema mesophilum]SDX38631.1 mannose-6-phosphate isomerase, type 1 [Marininema mesophilum]